MSWLARAMFLPGLALVLTPLPVPLNAQQESPRQSGSQSAPGTFELLAGRWSYNEDESVNAATGRPERSPRGAAQRSPVGRGAAAAPGSPVAGVPTPVSGRGVGAPSPIGTLGPTVAMIQENRSLTRDLLEVPEALMIRVAPGAVTFIDDLERARIFPTTGAKERYQLGAARFNAVAEWNGTQFIKRIDGADGFRMTETYFLSVDGQRLFVIVRVSSERKGAPVMGVNRVYDRVDQ